MDIDTLGDLNNPETVKRMIMEAKANATPMVVAENTAAMLISLIDILHRKSLLSEVDIAEVLKGAADRP